MPEYIDQTGQQIILSKPPKKIISLVPSQTELLYDLGLHQEVNGITKFCVHPVEWFRTKTKVGGTKQLKTDLIKQLKPDLIIANKEENVKEQVEELQKHFPVWVSDVNNLNDAYQMIEQVGKMTSKEKKASTLITGIKSNFSLLPTHHSRPAYRTGRLTTCYLIWQNPYMAAGEGTFIHFMMEAAGFENIFKNKIRYPEMTIEELQAAHCQLILLSSEPFPFKQKHVEELKAHGIMAQVLLVDGEMFSWYGSRLLKAPEYFMQLQKQINPSSH